MSPSYLIIFLSSLHFTSLHITSPDSLGTFSSSNFFRLLFFSSSLSSPHLPSLPSFFLFLDAHYCDELSWHELSKWLTMPVRCSLLLTMRSNPNIAQRKQFKSEELGTSMSRDSATSISLPNVRKLSIKTFLNSLDAGSKYGLRLNLANLKIIENPGTLVLEMKDLNEEEIEDLLAQSLSKFLVLFYVLYFVFYILFLMFFIFLFYFVFCILYFIFYILYFISYISHFVFYFSYF